MIAEARAAIFEHLDATFDVAVFHWFPDDMTEVPCIVVGRPTGELVTPPGVHSFPVVVVGRSLNDESQEQLDTLTDEVWHLLVKGVPGLSARFVRYTPAVESIGGSDFPVYVLTLDVMDTYC